MILSLSFLLLYVFKVHSFQKPLMRPPRVSLCVTLPSGMVVSYRQLF